MRILHTESSTGWGGQEIRILREAEGMRERGHTLYFAVEKGAQLGARARAAGFAVDELSFSKWHAGPSIAQLVWLCKKERINLVNTHSSMDAWLGGIAARCAGASILRTRHLSTTIRAGLNSRLLYGKLADAVATTCSAIVPTIQRESGQQRVLCVPTGIDERRVQATEAEAAAFRAEWGFSSDTFVVGTVCVVRSWKGIPDLIQAASLLRGHPNLRWVIVGGGYLDTYRPLVKEAGLEGIVLFTGELENPYPALRALDLFALLSTANEGISQASLQAAYLKRPLLTTTVGGLPEVCIAGKTGLLVPPRAPEAIACAVEELMDKPLLRHAYGENAKALVEKQFTFSMTLSAMEEIYASMP